MTEIYYKDAVQVRTDFCRTMKNGLIARGVASPNVSPGSDTYLLGTAVGNEIAVINANAIIARDQTMPDTASGEGLKNWGTVVNRAPQPAAGSVGRVIVDSSATTTIQTGATLIDDTGQSFEVITGGIYNDGEEVPIRAIAVGFATNHAEGDILRWSSAPPFCDEKAVVATGGLINGIDEDNEESYRARVLEPFQNPPASGNWSDVANDAEKSIGSVQKAFVYPAVYGPSTLSVAVVAAPTTSSKSRVLAASTVTNTVKPYVVGLHPGHADLDVTTVVDVNTDVAFALTLPEAATASPPGLGGGWKDGTPWPTPDGTTAFRCTVTSVTSSTQFVVDALTSPTKGVTRIAWLSPLDWKLYQAVVADVTGIAGAYAITIDRPFVGLMVGAYIWPDIENAQDFVTAALKAFALMGPGEKTSNASALVRGLRHPPPAMSWPNAIGPDLVRKVVDAASNAVSGQYLHRTNGTTTITGSAGQLSPPISATDSDPPRIHVPRHIAFYRAP